MNNEEKKQLIEEVTKETLDKMGFEAKIFVVEKIDSGSSDESINVDIQSDESKFLIGRQGANLAALQHLLRVMIKNKCTEPVHFGVDVNGYKENQKRNIIRLAQEMAARATSEQKTVMLEPMNSYERRLVHMELADFKGVKTESTGEGEDRKVVVKPVSIEDELGL